MTLRALTYASRSGARLAPRSTLWNSTLTPPAGRVSTSKCTCRRTLTSNLTLNSILPPLLIHSQSYYRGFAHSCRHTTKEPIAESLSNGSIETLTSLPATSPAPLPPLSDVLNSLIPGGASLNSSRIIKRHDTPSTWNNLTLPGGITTRLRSTASQRWEERSNGARERMADMKLEAGKYQGRSVPVTNFISLQSALGRLGRTLAQNSVRRELRLVERYEKPTDKRRRLKSERHRRRFAEMVSILTMPPQCSISPFNR